MALTKYASLEGAEVLEVKSSAKRVKTASLDKMSDFHDYRTDDGYLYVRIRAISSRVNKNNDGWPAVELAGGPEQWEKISSQRESGSGFTVEASKDHKFGFSTFMGKPNFIDHHNSDPKRARGVVVDSKLNVLDNKTASEGDDYWGGREGRIDSEHLPATEVELLIEVDAESFPKYAKAIVDGDLDGFSMGCDVEYSKCSHCGNKATNPDDYCSHIVMKGADHRVESGEHAGKTASSYENCYGISFFEISGVFDPADETALAREVVASVNNEKPRRSYLASKTALQPPEPQSMQTKAPAEVNTLREDKICPQCGSDFDDHKCAVCGFEEPPESMQNPDLERAQMNDEVADATAAPDPSADPAAAGAPGTQDAVSYLNARKPQPTASVNSEMWNPKGIDTSKLAADKPQGDEPIETVTSDQDKPVTSALRTANELIQAAKRNQEKNMSDQTKVAAEPADASGKPDKRVDVEGVGGVIDATNEQASKPKGPNSWEPKGTTVDVEGKGAVLEGTNEEAAKPSQGTVDVEKVVDTKDSGPTKTWDNSNEPNSAVTDKAVQAAKAGPKPIGGPDVQPQRREDVEQESGFSNPQKGTDQWTGTGGNGVSKQADPVTNKVGGFISLAALKLADAEVELGLTPKDKKYDRLAELAEMDESDVVAEHRALAKVKTAGLTRTASKGGAQRVPSFKRIASDSPAPTQPVDDALLDSAFFTR